MKRYIKSSTDDIITFREWCDANFYEDFDLSGLSDEEYYDLEDQYREDVPRNRREPNYR